MTAKVAALVGPTAVGKTEASLRVAEELGAEIVSVDSMQVYRGMDVGTAKPSPADMARVPHHLVDLRDPSHELTVAEYQELGRAAIEEISARGRLPLLVGGSGLYFREGGIKPFGHRSLLLFQRLRLRAHSGYRLPLSEAH
jgi:tRNA dimethylallyltransferase